MPAPLSKAISLIGIIVLYFAVIVAAKPLTLSRSDPIPQRWKWITGRAKFIEQTARDENMRVVDISAQSENPPLFAAVLAENTGKQEEDWFLYTGLNRFRVERRLDVDDTRFTYLETYGANTGTTDLLYAAIAVRDKRPLSWSRCLRCDFPPEDGRSKFTEYNSISSFIELGKRRWVTNSAFVSKRDRARKRSVFTRKTAAAIREEAKGRRVIIVDIHRHEDGKYSAILEKLDKPVESYWLMSMKPEDIDAEAKARSARVYDLESYRVGGELVYDVLMVEN